MKTVNDVYKRKYDRPIKILQFGEGNFLRAFADYLVDVMNEKAVFDGSVAICQPIENGLCDLINSQDGIYTLMLRGRENGEATEKSKIIESVKKCVNPYTDYNSFLEIAHEKELKIIISNTTEAGIAFCEGDSFDDTPPSSYPAKLTRFLYERFSFFNGSDESTVYILPVELIENNGTELYRCVNEYAKKWDLSEDFCNWLKKCSFSHTLVDRIVTGYPKKDAEAILI